MPIDFEALKSSPRVLIEVALKPVVGTRIQPTGFPDLGPAVYDAPDGTPTLLVESAQSMANRLEAVCWDEALDNLAKPLDGMPFVRVEIQGLGGGTDATSSLLEFHRLNSPYIMAGVTKEEIQVSSEAGEKKAKFPPGSSFEDVMTAEIGLVKAKSKAKAKPEKARANEVGGDEVEGDNSSQEGEEGKTEVAGVVNLRRLAWACFHFDPNSLVHGIFLEKIAGRLRHPRALSSFIEATGVGRADSGGVKFDRVLPSPKIAGVDAKGGYGNVPFHRSEFTAKSITAFFSLDLAQLRGYGLPDDATQFLVALSLWKVRKFLDSSMRLRSACELELVNPGESIVVKGPEGFALPAASDLENEILELLVKCGPLFANPAETKLTWKAKVKSASPGTKAKSG